MKYNSLFYTVGPCWLSVLYIEEGNGNPLQYSCLGNPMDRGSWRATVYGVAAELDRTE